MRKHKSTLVDAAADLYRCVYFTLGKDGFESENYKRFLEHAEKILADFDTNEAQMAKKLVIKAKDETKEKYKRQEDLLTASLMLK